MRLAPKIRNGCRTLGRRVGGQQKNPILSPSAWASDYQVIAYQRFMLNLLRFAPSELFNEATMTFLMPSVRSLGPLTMEQVHGAIPSPLPLGQSLLVVWPQLTGLIAVTVVCFALSYVSFMRKEVRSR